MSRRYMLSTKHCSLQVVHPEENAEVDPRSMVGRIALCLFAAAIVWPELPE